jgi:hypothetical protein
MSKLKNMLEGRQFSEHVFVEIIGAQLIGALANNAGVVEFEAPQGSVLVSGSVRVLEAFDGTTPTLDVGDADDDDRYTGTAIDLTAVANTAFTPTGFVYGESPNTNVMQLTYAAGGTPTEVGRLLLQLEFVKLNKAYYTQGNYSAPSVPPNPGPHV